MSEQLAHDAINFYNKGMDQLDTHVLVGEPQAKAAMLVGLVLRKNIVLSGIPGGGKSTLATSFHGLIEGVNPEDVVMIPGQHDLLATQLVGGQVINAKMIEVSDKEKEGVINVWNEKHTHDIAGMVTPTTKVLHLEEPNRAPAHALQSILPVLENRRMETSAGNIEVPDMLAVVASMNPTESRESTFKISNAMASRFTVGAIMGEIAEEKRQEKNRAIRKFKGNPADVEAIIDIPTLSGLREYVLDSAITPDIDNMIDVVTVGTADALKDHRVIESDNRIAKQIEANAKALAGMRNENHVVSEADVSDAVKLVAAARLGMLNNLAGDSVASIAYHIVKNS